MHLQIQSAVTHTLVYNRRVICQMKIVQGTRPSTYHHLYAYER